MAATCVVWASVEGEEGQRKWHHSAWGGEVRHEDPERDVAYIWSASGASRREGRLQRSVRYHMWTRSPREAPREETDERKVRWEGVSSWFPAFESSAMSVIPSDAASVSWAFHSESGRSEWVGLQAHIVW